MPMSSSDAEALDRRVGFLMDPASHGVAPRDVSGPIETHGAVVVLAGDRAYKIKKPVDFPYMDLSTRSRRRRICKREVEVNRRTAPDMYIGVSGLTERDGVLSWVEDIDSDRNAEPVVVMRRFDERRLLDRMVAADMFDLDLCEPLAATIAQFQDAAERRRSVAGSERVSAVLAINAAGLRAGSPTVLDGARTERLITATEKAARRIGGLLDRRGRSGRIRRLHGDLHLGNIFLDERDRPVLFDAVEFDEDLATIDVAYDLAYLLMDLAHRDRRDAACRIWNAWLERSDGGRGLGDDGAAAALPLFLSMRAAIRAHVGAAKAMQHAEDPEPAETARGYLEHALGYLDRQPGHVLCIAGLSGTGKSTLARAVAPRLSAAPGATVLRSDAIRKRLAGVGQTDRLPEHAYSRAMSARVYAALHRRARRQAEAGRVVIADAVYAHRSERERLTAAARRAGVPFTGIWLDLSLDAAKRRVAARRGDVSDATPEIVDLQHRFADPPEGWLVLDAGRPVDALVRAVLEAVRR